MWNSISKDDIIIAHIEDHKGEEFTVRGQVKKITNTELFMNDQEGMTWIVERDRLIDVDHIEYASDEERDMYSDDPNGYYLYND